AVSGALSPDGRRAAVVAVGWTERNVSQIAVVGWDLISDKKLGTCVLAGDDWTGVAVALRCATATPGRLAVVVGAARRLHVCDLLTGKRQRVIEGPWQYVSAGPVFSPDGRTFAVVTADRKTGVALRVIEWATGGTRHAFAIRAGRTQALAYSPD